MVLIIFTKNESNLTNRYWDMVPDRQKVWTDGMDGRTDDAKTIFLRLCRGIKTEVSLLKIIFKSEFEWSASWIMSWDFKLLICSLNLTSSDTTRHDTGLWTELSLARGSGDCFDFAAAFPFDGKTEFVKAWRDNDIWCHSSANCRPGWGREVLWNFHTYIGSGHFFLGGGGGGGGWGSTFWISIFLGFVINEYFFGIRFCGYFLGGHHKIGVYLGVISVHFRVFFTVKVQNGEYYLGVAKISDIFLVCLKFLIFFLGEQ